MTSLLRYVYRHAILASVLLNVGIFAACLLFASPRFQTNDDIAIIFSLRGIMNFSEASALILYSNPLWTLFVKFFYDIFPSFEWYPLLLEGILLITNIILTSFFLRKRNPPTLLLLVLLLAIIAVIPFLYLHLQFTIVAAFVSAAGFLIFFQEERGKKWPAIGLLLICLAALIRFEAILLSWILTSLCYVLETWRNTDPSKRILSVMKKLRWTKLLLPVLVFGALSFSGFYFLPKPYMESLQYNWLRAGFNEYDQLGKILPAERAQVLSSAGFSENDYRLMRLWFCEDTSAYSLQRLKNLNTAYNQTDKHLPPIGRRFIDGAITFWHAATSHPYLEFIFFSVAIVAMSSNMRFASLYFLLSISIIGAYYIFIYIYFKTPAQRVYAGYFYAIPFLMLSASRFEAHLKIRHFAVAAVTLLLSLQAARYLRALSKSDDQKTTAFLSDLSFLRSYENKKLILVGNSLKYETVPAFAVENTFHFKAYSIGSLSVLPRSRELIQKYKLQNLAQAASRDKDCFFVVSPDQLNEFAPSLIRFVKEHYAETIRQNIIQSASTFVIVQFTRDSTAF